MRDEMTAGKGDPEPKVLTRKASHDRVVELLRARRPGRILDVPCGHGALASRVKRLGFEVHCCDIDVKLFALKDVEIKEGNLNGSLPYPGGSFDYVLCVAGLHRVHRLEGALRELGRVLAPGGELILSFPNYSSLENRLKFLFNGSISKSVNQMAFHEAHSEDPDAHFRHLLLYPQVHFALERAGFVVEGLAGDRLKVKSLVLLPLVLPLKLFVIACSRRYRDLFRLRETTSMALLTGGNNLIVTARKSAPGAGG